MWVRGGGGFEEIVVVVFERVVVFYRIERVEEFVYD